MSKTIKAYLSGKKYCFEATLPAKLVVCLRCEGTGRHTNPAIDGQGITGSEANDLGEDFMNSYAAGYYDVTCEECAGQNVVHVVDVDALKPKTKAAYFKALDEEYQASMEY